MQSPAPKGFSSCASSKKISSADDAERVNSTVELLDRARSGEQEALNVLFRRYIPLLKRWASGRLPLRARSMVDTEDLVQETVINTLRHLPDFEYRDEAALHRYLRRALKNYINDEIRRADRRPAETTMGEEQPDKEQSPLAEVIERQIHEEYEQALGRLKSKDRELVIARLELGMSYEEIARGFGKSSPDAARMAVARAVSQVAEEMAR